MGGNKGEKSNEKPAKVAPLPQPGNHLFEDDTNPADTANDAAMIAKTQIKHGDKVYEGVTDKITVFIQFPNEGPLIDVLCNPVNDSVVDALEMMVPGYSARNRDNIPTPALKKALTTALKNCGIRPDVRVTQTQALEIVPGKGKGKPKFVLKTI